MDAMVKHKVCPTCGSERLRRVQKAITRTFRGKTYKVPSVEFHECPECGETIYSPEAVRKIAAHSPAFATLKVF
jgi:YgiT-type zinc finger domain-containing protein